MALLKGGNRSAACGGCEGPQIEALRACLRAVVRRSAATGVAIAIGGSAQKKERCKPAHDPKETWRLPEFFKFNQVNLKLLFLHVLVESVGRALASYHTYLPVSSSCGRSVTGFTSGPTRAPRTFMDLTCDICNLACASRTGMLRHKRRHVRVFTCPVCPNYSCKDHSSLRYHFRAVHSNERPYTCPLQCGYAGRNLAALRAHRLVHTRNPRAKEESPS